MCAPASVSALSNQRGAHCSLCVLWVPRTRVAVNDAVVMREWGLAQKVEGKVMLLADADGSFRFAPYAPPRACSGMCWLSLMFIERGCTKSPNLCCPSPLFLSLTQ